MCVYIFICICVYIYIYIYTYTCHPMLRRARAARARGAPRMSCDARHGARKAWRGTHTSRLVTDRALDLASTRNRSYAANLTSKATHRQASYSAQHVPKPWARPRTTP